MPDFTKQRKDLPSCFLKGQDRFFNSRVIRDLEEFKRISDVILAKRYSEDISDVMDKVYTRDLYFKD